MSPDRWLRKPYTESNLSYDTTASIPYFLMEYMRRSILCRKHFVNLGTSPSTNKPKTVFLAPGPAIWNLSIFS